MFWEGGGKAVVREWTYSRQPHDLSNLNVITVHATEYDTKQIIK